MKLKRLAVCALAACMIGTGAMIHVDAFSLGSVLGGVAKVGGIGFLVSKYGESINSAINSVMMKEGAGTNYATKVVPIVSIGNSGYIGAAQVIGDAEKFVGPGREGKGCGSAGSQLERQTFPYQRPDSHGQCQSSLLQPCAGSGRICSD